MSAHAHRRMARRPRHHLQNWVGLCLALVPLALGGAHPAVNVTLGTCITVATAVWVVGERPQSIRLNLPMAVVLLAWLGTLLQMLPLPAVVLGAITPKAADIWSLLASSEPSPWRPMTLEPPATAHALVKLATYGSGTLLAAGLFRHRRERRRLLRWVAAGGVAVTLLGFLQALGRVDTPYATFGSGRGGFVASFINPNHLAGFLGFSSLLMVGLGLDARSRARWGWLGAAVLAAAGTLLSLSRGGLISLLFALGFLAASLGLARRQRGRANARAAYWAQAVLALSLLVAGYVAYSEIVTEVWTLRTAESIKKTEIWAKAPALMRDFPLGVGRGAFRSVFPHYLQANVQRTFTHLENEPLQAMVDWGPLMGAVLLAGVGWAWLRLMRSAAGQPLELGVASALLFLGVHNLGDFNLALTGVALPAVMVFTAFAAPHVATSGGAPEGGTASALPRWAAYAIALIALATVATAAWPAVTHSLRRDTQRLAKRLRADVPPSQHAAPIRAILARHPADYVLPLMAAEAELNHGAGDPRQALRWVNRGMYLAPEYAGAHRIAARALVRLGVIEQALLEYRLATAAEPAHARQIVSELYQATASLEAVERLARPEQPELVAAVAAFLLRRDAAQPALQQLRAVLGDTPPAAPEQAQGPKSKAAAPAELLLLRARAHAALDERAKALAWSRAMQELYPRRVEGYTLEARLQRDGDAPGRALGALNRGVERVADARSLLHRKARLELQTGALDAARRTLRALLQQSGSAKSLARAYILGGDIHRAQGRLAAAIREYERARDMAPGNVGHHLRLIRLRLQLDDLTGARAALRRARRTHPQNHRLKALAKRARQRAKQRRRELLEQELLVPRPGEPGR